MGASGKLRGGQEIGEEAEKGKKNLRQIEALSFPINAQVTKYTCTKSEVILLGVLWHHICLLISNIFDTLDMNSILFQNTTDRFGPDLTKIRNNVHQV